MWLVAGPKGTQCVYAFIVTAPRGQVLELPLFYRVSKQDLLEAIELRSVRVLQGSHSNRKCLRLRLAGGVLMVWGLSPQPAPHHLHFRGRSQ